MPLPPVCLLFDRPHVYDDDRAERSEPVSTLSYLPLRYCPPIKEQCLQRFNSSTEYYSPLSPLKPAAPVVDNVHSF